MLLPAFSPTIERMMYALNSQSQGAIAITSPSGGEGVSSVSSSLVNRLLLSGKSALLLDLNPGSPSLVPALDTNILTNTNGAGETPLNNTHATNQHVIASEAEHNNSGLPPVRLMTTREGLAAVNAVQLFDSTPLCAKLRQPGVLKELLQQWLQDYDYIIVDCPRLNDCDDKYIPTELIAEACDAMILVTLACVTSESALIQALAKIDRQRSNIIGVMINDRENPSLRSELIREINKLECWLPRCCSRPLQAISRLLTNSHLLSMEL